MTSSYVEIMIYIQPRNVTGNGSQTRFQRSLTYSTQATAQMIGGISKLFNLVQINDRENQQGSIY